MDNKNKSATGLLFLILGIIFLLIGIILVFQELMLSFMIPSVGGGYIHPHLFEYPHQFFGIFLILSGIIVLIIGINLWQNRPKKEI